MITATGLASRCRLKIKRGPARRIALLGGVLLLLFLGIAGLTASFRRSGEESVSSQNTGGIGGGSLGFPPQLTVIYTGETNGFLQSCGCSSGQVGGLAKRATLVKRFSANRSALLVDSGNLAVDLQRSEAVLHSMEVMGYQALALGKLELALGESFVRRAIRHNVPLISCPLPDESSGLATHVIVHRGRLEVAVVSLREGTGSELLPAARQVLAEVRRRAKLVIVLSALDAGAEQDLVQQDGVGESIDLLIGMRGHSNPIMVRDQNVTLVPITQKGEVGVVEAVPASGGGWEFSHRMEKVNDNLAADPEVQQVVSSYYAHQARQFLEASLASRMNWQNLGYEPAYRCGDCHPAQVRLWQQSKHALASQHLRDRDRLVPECLRCHSEMYRRTEKFNPSVSLAWQGVECATCHGSATLHCAIRTRESVTRSIGRQGCQACHDQENDPNFDFERYLEKIRHW